MALESADLWYYLCREVPALLAVAGSALADKGDALASFECHLAGLAAEYERHEKQQLLTPETRSHRLTHKQDKAPKARADRP